jgi:hypothetical protein
MSQTRLLSLLATLIAVPVAAQGGTACLQGRVYGAAGSPLMGARVLLLNTGTAVATDIEGRSAFPSPAGHGQRAGHLHRLQEWHGHGLIVGRPNCATGLHPRGVEGDHPETGGATTGDGRQCRRDRSQRSQRSRSAPARMPLRRARFDGRWRPGDSNGRALQLVPVYEQPPRLGSNPSNRNVYVDGVPVQRTRQPVSGTACLQRRASSLAYRWQGPGSSLNPQIATVTDGYGQYSFGRWRLTQSASVSPVLATRRRSSPGCGCRPIGS